MKIILLKDVAKVGKKFEIKEVAEGFALNMLIPRKMALVATAQAIKKVEQEKEKFDAEKKIQADLLAKNISTIKGLSVTIKGKANEKGHLFAGITKDMIAEEILKSTRLNLDNDLIKLEKPIKELGEHKVMVEALDKKAEFTVVVEAE